jgi:hypothetical protein
VEIDAFDDLFLATTSDDDNDEMRDDFLFEDTEEDLPELQLDPLRGQENPSPDLLLETSGETEPMVEAKVGWFWCLD